MPIGRIINVFFLLRICNYFFGKMDHKYNFTVRKSEDMGWLSVKPDKGVSTNNSSLKIQLNAQKTGTTLKGMIFIRLENGFSIPITVYNNPSNIKN